MKFKMAPNSLFAVLLRSPWWISFALALAVAALAHALLPEPYRVVGSLGGFPFFAVGCVAFWRQMRAPSAAQMQSTTQAVAGLAWPEFLQALEQAFTREGFAVERLHGAADLALQRQGRTTLVLARRWKAARQGEEALQALQAQVQARDASGGICIALGEFSPNALRYAKAHQIELVQQEGLARLLRGVKLKSA